MSLVFALQLLSSRIERDYGISVPGRQNGRFCPWQQGCTFVELFGGRGCTPSPPRWRWNGHFVFVCLMWAVKLQGPRQGQLSPRTTATIVYTFAYTCVHGPSAPRCKLCGWICVLCVDLGKRVKTHPLWKFLECQWSMLAFLHGEGFPQTANIDLRHIVPFII